MTMLWKKWNVFCKVEVEITSLNTAEAAINKDGLGRKMATLFCNSLPRKLVQGMENEYSFIHDLYKIEDFFCFGQFVALAILHWYEPLRFLNIGLSSLILGKFNDSFHDGLFKFVNKNLHISSSIHYCPCDLKNRARLLWL